MVESEKLGFYVINRELGVVHVTLAPDLFAEAETHQYPIPELPTNILSFCQELKAIGGRALLVGGFARDLVRLHERQTAELDYKDIDIEVFGIAPEKISQLIGNKGFEINVKGESYAVLKVKFESSGDPTDVSIPRRESSTGVGHGEFVVEGDPSMSLKEAGLRRDLTINALSFDPLLGTLYDPFGGKTDICNGIIRVVNQETFQEDPLRVLRIMQFSARLGYVIDEKTIALCKRMVERGDIDTEPIDRITTGFKKLVTKGKLPSLGLQFARETGLIQRYWPELEAIIDVPQDPDWHPEGDVWKHTLQVMDACAEIAERECLSDQERCILVLSALGHDLAKAFTTEIGKDGRYHAYGHEAKSVEPMRQFFNRFKFPKFIETQVLELIPEHMRLPILFEQEVKQGQDMTSALRKLVARLRQRKAHFSLLVYLSEADQRGRNGNGDPPLSFEATPRLQGWNEWIITVQERSEEKQVLQQMVNGDTLMNYFGISKGTVWLGVLLRAVYQAQLEGEIATVGEGTALGARLKQMFDQTLHTEDDWKRAARLEDPRELLG